MWVILILVAAIGATTPQRPKCPGPNAPPDCGPYGSFVVCPGKCQPQNCSSLWSKFRCDDDGGCASPTCICDEGYLKDDQTGNCITVQECMNPIRCGPNEVKVKCKTICPPQSCNISYTDYSCNSTFPCEEGCDCIKDYLRDDSGNCVLNDKCPPPPTNATIEPPVEETTVPPTKPLKSQSSASAYSKSFSSSSVSKSSSRSFASSSSSSYSTATSRFPKGKPKPGKCGVNEKWVRCKTICPPQSCAISYTTYSCKPSPSCEPGCDCIKDYLRDNNGVCVLNDECPPPPVVTESPEETSLAPVTENPEETSPPPETSSCSANETFVYCNAGCPTNNCPTSDTRAIVACSPPRPCPPGCACNRGYRRKSYEDKSCILAEDCPPVTCTRPNEVWNSCPSPCLSEYCGDQNKPPVACNELIKDCRPKCVCADGFYRNESDICVPAYECPTKECPANQTYVSCNVRCPTENCPVDDSRFMVACAIAFPCPPGCACQPNYRRKSYDDETCILAEDCPPVTCTRQNEEWNSCPSPCLSEYCEDANKSPSACYDSGQGCQPKCVCKQGFLRNGNDTCVPVNECPPPKCPGANEEWNTCPSPCLSENCLDKNNPPSDCNQVGYDCKPKCVCQPGFFRDDNNICVPFSECGEGLCNANETYAFCKAGCPYDYCPEDDSLGFIACDPPYPCPKGCVCKPNYKRRSREDDTCILTEECAPLPCDRPNEEYDPCTSSCLAESCRDYLEPQGVCNEFVQSCQPKCVCQKDYYRNDSGICVPGNECGVKCGANETFSECTFGCPQDFCPADDDLVLILCKPPRDCPDGCRCKLNYKWKSFDDRTCVLASDCPPVNCTRENEIWSSCPSPCLRESCADVDNQTKICNYLVQDCQPRCICEKNFFRNEDGNCVPASKCPKKMKTCED